MTKQNSSSKDTGFKNNLRSSSSSTMMMSLTAEERVKKSNRSQKNDSQIK
jgi:hypothetical protein